MLNKIKNLFSSRDLLQGNFGIEREAIRVTENGKLANSEHPRVFGDKINNPYITTDFSESQVEVITPAFDNIEETYHFTRALYDIVALNIGEEYLWPQSMPSIVPLDKDIPLASYGDNEKGKQAREYREMLIKKYGGRKQLISGIHYNFSFKEDIIETLYEKSDKKDSYKIFKDSIYLKVARNYLRYRWLIIYLVGATSTVDESYFNDCKKCRKELEKCFISGEPILSYRNGECGYKNKVDLFPSYKSVNNYIETIKEFINDDLISNHKELYNHVRLKPADRDNFFESLSNDGIKYLEYRSIDVNPFEKGGISLDDLEFLQLFNIFLLVKEESNYKTWQEEAMKNQYRIAKDGPRDVELLKDGTGISKTTWALEIMEELKNINSYLELGKRDIIDKMEAKVKDFKLTYSYRINELVKEKGYIETYLDLAKAYKKEAYNNRFKLEGYEDLELSTQILMKEAIKRGIEVKVVDRSDNFISLKKDGKLEYVKQATKTSKDNYITVLVMENKTVTKKVLNENNIRVPEGMEFYKVEDAKVGINAYINKPIVIKPKSTNFGTGISIFPEGASREDIIKAFEIAFKHDNTVLIEEFIKGKEYRFLVIGDEVVGILHRVPANVIGNGKNSIRELVTDKNKDPLRGHHYRTPLEIINLDENAELFLKQQHKDFNYIPRKDEIVYLRENSNISTGGDSIDYTDDIPEKYKSIAIASAKAAGAKICGVDMMLEDYRDENTNYAIIELNFNPAIHIHSFPYKGKEREIAVKVIKLLGF